MPLTLHLGFEYRRTSLHFVQKCMTVCVATFVRLNDEEITDLCCSVLAESLHRQRECAGLTRSDFTKLVLMAESLKPLASGREIYSGKCAVVEASLRTERECEHPRALRVEDFSLRALLPKTALCDQARWAASARDVVIDPRWNRGRFSA